jgi:hypothetical protein
MLKQTTVVAESDDSYRVRLEGRAEVLEVARLRFIALAQMVRSLRWRARLRRNTALVRETAAAAPVVDAALDHLFAKAKRERWPQRTQVLQLGEEVSALWDETLEAGRRRLRDDKELPMQQVLEQLERVVLTQPQLILPGQRTQVANELLPRSLPEFGVIAHFGEVLEQLFKRPIQPMQRLPFTVAEFDELRVLWLPGEQALQAVWRRIAMLDSAGTLTRFLRRRARRAPMRRANTGPELLLAAEFWSTLAVARLKEIAAARLSPLSCRDDELFAVVRWQLLRQEEPTATLDDASVQPSRAGLLELAHELAAPPKKQTGADRLWQRLRRAALQADQGPRDEADYQSLRDNLNLFLKVLDRDESPPLYRAGRRLEAPKEHSSASLTELVDAIRTRVA